MPIFSRTILLRTKGFCDVHDVTPAVEGLLRESGLRAGLATVFIAGSTAGVTTIEYEPGLIRDMKSMFDRLIPESIEYAHNERWNDDNGFSHVRASLLGPSVSVPFDRGKLTLGAWQQIVVVDFDNRSRERQVTVQFLGE